MMIQERSGRTLSQGWCVERQAPVLLDHFSQSAGDFARLYKEHELQGGHVIKLGPGNEDAAREALDAWPGLSPMSTIL